MAGLLKRSERELRGRPDDAHRRVSALHAQYVTGSCSSKEVIRQAEVRMIEEMESRHTQVEIETLRAP